MSSIALHIAQENWLPDELHMEGVSGSEGGGGGLESVAHKLSNFLP